MQVLDPHADVGGTFGLKLVSSDGERWLENRSCAGGWRGGGRGDVITKSV